MGQIFRKKTLPKIWCYRTAHVCCQYSQWITKQRNGSISPNFLKGNPSENLVLSNRPCLLPAFSIDNTAAQRFDSTKFSERQPFRNFGAFEPPWITQQRSGSIASNFLKENPSQNLVLSNRPCLLSVLAMDNTAAQRFDNTKFMTENPPEN